MAEMTRKLAGKVAVVTGASQGLGEHLAFELAANGAAVALAARNRERLEAIGARSRLAAAGLWQYPRTCPASQTARR